MLLVGLLDFCPGELSLPVYFHFQTSHDVQGEILCSRRACVLQTLFVVSATLLRFGLKVRVPNIFFFFFFSFLVFFFYEEVSWQCIQRRLRFQNATRLVGQYGWHDNSTMAVKTKKIRNRPKTDGASN